MDTTNLRQVEGGTVIKQSDRSSTMSFILQDAIGREVDLGGQTAQIALYTLKGKYWETSTQVKGAMVSFSLPGNLSEDDYILDISVAGYVFPSDRDLIIRVVKGYADLMDKETAESTKKTLDDVRREVEAEANRRLEEQFKNINADYSEYSRLLEENKDKALSDIQTQRSEIESDGQEYIKLIGTNKASAVAQIEAKKKEVLDIIEQKRQEFKGDPGKDGTMSIKDMTQSQKESFAEEFGLNIADKVDKEVGKGLSDNNFTNYYKNKLDTLDKSLDLKADKKDVKSQVQEVKDLIFDSSAKYHEDTIYILDTVLEGGEVKIKPKEIGKLVANDFLRVQVDSDKYRFRIKSTSQGVILFYSMTDKDLRYAIHVYPQIKDYEINFGKKVKDEMIFTTVSMPEDKISIIREEGL